MKCMDNYYIYNNQCLEECPINTKINEEMKLCADACYSNQYLNDSKCENCTGNCILCSLNRDDTTQIICSKCMPDYYLLENSCTQSCPLKYDKNTQCCVAECQPNQYILLNDCENCEIEYCVSCSSKEICTICQYDYYLIENKSQCIKCEENC
eukprot:TRINITY_DN10644_c0_g1_i2.p3 TRINITY_DN10644_c0_g1~~TRINITY_DN10644_c0_g1_i2.p3  ORF type:complete len:153 (-),score=37.29 TRINITY_DN10644_c0_g1_i2:223-681(-)